MRVGILHLRQWLTGELPLTKFELRPPDVVDYAVFGWYLIKPIWIPSKTQGLYEVHQSYIFAKHRRQGWSETLINSIVNIDNLGLVSGNQQTAAARALWKKLIRSDEYKITAYDVIKRRRVEFKYDPTNNELDCSFPIYDKTYPPTERDIRLIARKKRDNSVRSPDQLHVG